jgi:hypothetical protein
VICRGLSRGHRIVKLRRFGRKRWSTARPHTAATAFCHSRKRERSVGEPKVRIHLPPAASQQRTVRLLSDMARARKDRTTGNRAHPGGDAANSPARRFSVSNHEMRQRDAANRPERRSVGCGSFESRRRRRVRWGRGIPGYRTRLPLPRRINAATGISA